MNLRLKRLINDYTILLQYLYENPYVNLIKSAGNPPEKYQLEYHVKSLQILNNTIVGADLHQVEISLPMEYPSIQPQCRMLTPVFHPNIAPHAICIADFWAAGESLKDVVIRIGEMLCYQNYSIKSPLNGEAAKWAYENSHRLPIDMVDLRDCGSDHTVDIGIVSNNTIQNSNTYSDAHDVLSCSCSKTDDHPNTGSSTYNISNNQVSSDISNISCSNCGTETPDYINARCSSNHIICRDCIVKCSKCGKELCIICQIQKCPVCNKIICSSCQDVCSLCKKAVCSVHIKACAVCGRKFCSNCMSQCPECELYYCRLHYNEFGSRCVSCSTTPSAWK